MGIFKGGECGKGFVKIRYIWGRNFRYIESAGEIWEEVKFIRFMWILKEEIRSYSLLEI